MKGAKHMNKLITLLTALGIIIGSVQGISLIFGMSAYADEDVHLSDAQKLEVFNGLVPDVDKYIHDTYATRKEVIDIFYRLYVKSDIDITDDKELTDGIFKDVTTAPLHVELVLVNMNVPTRKNYINGTGDGYFRPGDNCKLSEFVKMALGIGGVYVKIYSQRNLNEFFDIVYPNDYMNCAAALGLINEEEDPDRFITAEDVRNILSKLVYERALECYYAFSGEVYKFEDRIITKLYGIDVVCGKLNKMPGDKIKVGDTEITGSVDKSFYMKNCTALYKEDGEEKVLYKVFADESQAVD